MKYNRFLIFKTIDKRYKGCSITFMMHLQREGIPRSGDLSARITALFNLCDSSTSFTASDLHEHCKRSTTRLCARTSLLVPSSHSQRFYSSRQIWLLLVSWYTRINTWAGLRNRSVWKASFHLIRLTLRRESITCMIPEVSYSCITMDWVFRSTKPTVHIYDYQICKF